MKKITLDKGVRKEKTENHLQFRDFLKKGIDFMKKPRYNG